MNFVRMKTQSTTNVAIAPSALTTIDFFQCVGAVTSSVTNSDRCSSTTASTASGSGLMFVVASAACGAVTTVTRGGGPLVGSFAFAVGACVALRSFSQCLTIPACESVK